MVPGSVELMEASFYGEYGVGGERDIHKGRYVLVVVWWVWILCWRWIREG